MHRVPVCCGALLCIAAPCRCASLLHRGSWPPNRCTKVGANGAGTTVAGGEAAGNGTASGPGEAVETARDRKAAEAGGPAALEARTRLGPIIALPPAEDPALLDDETLLALPTL